MKNFGLCVILLLVSAPLFAGVLGFSVGATGGVERCPQETFTAAGLTATFSPPFIPVGIRGGFEYSWWSSEASYIFTLLGIEYSIAPPFSPASFYAGTGAETSTFRVNTSSTSTSETDFGILVYGGVNLSMGMMSIFAESGLGTIFASDNETSSPYNYTYTHVPIRGGIKISL